MLKAWKQMQQVRKNFDVTHMALIHLHESGDMRMSAYEADLLRQIADLFHKLLDDLSEV